MTGPLPSRGRRDNGLVATEWGALVDLDPRLSEPLLDSLAAEGVAAYVEPASDLDSYTRASTLPRRPLDRLWVDPARADVARAIVAAEVADLTALLAETEPGATADGLVRPVPRTAAVRVLPPPELTRAPTDDEVFAQIVAGFNGGTAEPVGRWPAVEDVDDERSSPRRRRSDAPPPVEDKDGDDDGLPGWVEPDALPDEGHFEPPAPPRIPRPRLRTVLCSALLVLGLTMMFAPFQIGLDDSPIYLITGMMLTGGGATLLVAGMRDAPWSNDPDDGAVV